MNTRNASLVQGAVLMLIGSLAFIGYAVVFLFRNFTGGGFDQHNWVTHLSPIYVATLVFVVGALLALRAITRRTSGPIGS